MYFVYLLNSIDAVLQEVFKMDLELPLVLIDLFFFSFWTTAAAPVHKTLIFVVLFCLYAFVISLQTIFCIKQNQKV